MMQLSIQTSIFFFSPEYRHTRSQCTASVDALLAQAGDSVEGALEVVVCTTQPRSIIRLVKHKSTHESKPSLRPLQCFTQCFVSRFLMHPDVLLVAPGAVVVGANVVTNV
jgi:hypothetical protein